MPTPSFLHNMGVASIVAGIVLLGLAQVQKRKPVQHVKRAARKVR